MNTGFAGAAGGSAIRQSARDAETSVDLVERSGRMPLRHHFRYHAIMVRIQAQLTEDQALRLKELAAAEGVSVAELLRRGADVVLAQGASDGPGERKRRALEVVGRFRDTSDDVAERHDEHLDEGYGR